MTPPADSTRALGREVRGIQDTLARLAAQIAVVQRQTEQLEVLWREDADLGARLDRLEPILDPARIGVHVHEAVRQGELFEDPFPHIVVSSLFPPDVYEALVEAIPPRVFFEDRPVNRQQLPVPPKLAPTHAIATWEFLTGQVVRPVLGPALVARLQQPLDRHIRRLSPSVASMCEAGIQLSVSDERLLRRVPGRMFPPRSDPPWQFLTAIVYLARAGDGEDYGTDLFRLDEGRPPATARDVPGSGAARPVKAIPFRSNSALAFLNAAGTYGASIPVDAPADTERYTYQFRVAGDKTARNTLRAAMSVKA